MNQRFRNILVICVILVGLMSFTAAPLLGLVAGVVTFTPLSLTNVFLGLITLLLSAIAIGIFNR